MFNKVHPLKEVENRSRFFPKDCMENTIKIRSYWSQLFMDSVMDFFVA